MRLFDLVVAPKHDNIPIPKNIIETNGVLNSVQFIENKNLQQGLMLIGGESSHFVWDDIAIANQITQIIECDQHVDWTLTTSRRTPESFLQLLQEVSLRIVPVEETDKDWMNEHFASSGQIWVTPDSVSMVYEALSSGAITKVFHLDPTSKGSRVRGGLDVLIENGSVVSYEQWEQNPLTQQSPVFFNEAARVADYILEHLQ